MSLVVSDSGPIHYLVLCEAIEVIPKLYSRLVIPPAVIRELTHPSTPPSVSAWVRALPSWAAVQAASQVDPATQLGLGEREAIALALELKAAHLLVDDRAARRIATERGILVSGTIGLLEQAAATGFLNLEECLRKLLQTNFRIDREVIRQALASQTARRQMERGDNPN